MSGQGATSRPTTAVGGGEVAEDVVEAEDVVGGGYCGDIGCCWVEV